MEWKPVPGFPLLEASSTGLVRRLPQTVTFYRHRKQDSHGYYVTQNRPEKLLAQTPQKSGHLNVAVPDPRPETKSHMTLLGVHRAVCLAFHGLPPEGKPMALHRDGNPANNVPSNLYWGDHFDNEADKGKHGKKMLGEKHHRTHISDEQAAWIKSNYKAKSRDRGANAMAQMFGVHRTTIENIVSGRTFGHIGVVVQ